MKILSIKVAVVLVILLGLVVVGDKFKCVNSSEIPVWIYAGHFLGDPCCGPSYKYFR